MADKKKEYQKNVKTRKADKSPEEIAAIVAMTAPLAVFGAIDQFDKFKQEQKRKKLRAKTGPKFQNRTKIKGVSSAKIIKLP